MLFRELTPEEEQSFREYAETNNPETQKYLAPEEGKAAQSLMNAVFADDTRLTAGA
jgi:hypothetical protein